MGLRVCRWSCCGLLKPVEQATSELDEEFLPPSFSDHPLEEGSAEGLGGDVDIDVGRNLVDVDLDGFSVVGVHDGEFENPSMFGFDVGGGVL